jgi:hypothetical protein
MAVSWSQKSRTLITGQVHSMTWTFLRHLASADGFDFDAEE